MTRPIRLTVLLAGVASVATAVALLIGFRVLTGPPLAFLAIKDGSFTGPHRSAGLPGVPAARRGQRFSLRLRVAASAVQVAWGKTAINVASVWLPASLVPASVMVGTAIAHVARSIFTIC